MSRSVGVSRSDKLLTWTPRALGFLFVLFVSLFALDVFGENLGFWGTLFALFMHLIPSLVILLAVLLSWRWPWLGAVIFLGWGVWYLWMVISRDLPITWALVMAFPPFLVGALFLTGWWRRRRTQR
jgi:hypothetical protein